MFKLIFLALALICGLCAIVNIVSLVLYLSKSKRAKERLDSFGVQTQGTVKVYKYICAEFVPTVIFLENVKIFDPDRESIMTEFTVDGETVYHETLDYPSLEECAVGSAVTVTYDRESPSNFRIGNGKNAVRRGMRRIIFAAGFILAQIVSVILAIVL